MPEAAWLTPFRVDESGNRFVAGAIGLISPGPVMGLVAAGHEIVTRATGIGVFRILAGYVATLSTFGVVFGLLLGLPYILVFDRFVAGSRLLFVAGATAVAGIVGGLVYGWWWVFAVGAMIQAGVFVALLRIRGSDAS